MMDDWGRQGIRGAEGLHWGILVMVAALVALVIIVALVLRSIDRQRASRERPAEDRRGDSAVALLRSRLAAGEIDVAEFHERYDALEPDQDQG